MCVMLELGLPALVRDGAFHLRLCVRHDGIRYTDLSHTWESNNLVFALMGPHRMAQVKLDAYVNHNGFFLCKSFWDTFQGPR